MAIYRKLQTTFWNDPFIEGLDKDQRYFYLFLMTNPLSNQIGIYEVSIGYIARTCGFTEEKVRTLLQFFIQKNKIKYSESTQEIALKNWAKHNFSESPKVQACMRNEMGRLKNKELFGWLYTVGKHSKQEYDIYVPALHEYSAEEGREEEEVVPPVLAPPKPPKKPAKSEPFVPPTLEEVEAFFVEKGYSEEFSKNQGYKAFNHYALNEWKDTYGNPVKNWKQKIFTNWMKDKPETLHMPQSNTVKSFNELTPEERARISQEKADRNQRSGPASADVR